MFEHTLLAWLLKFRNCRNIIVFVTYDDKMFQEVKKSSPFELTLDHHPALLAYIRVYVYTGINLLDINKPQTCCVHKYKAVKNDACVCLWVGTRAVLMCTSRSLSAPDSPSSGSVFYPKYQVMSRQHSNM